MPTATIARIAAADPDAATAVAAAIEAEGCAVLEGVLDPATCSSLIAEIDRVEAAHGISEGTNEFEGHHTRRIFDLIGKSESLRDLTIDSTVLPAVEEVLGEGLLLSGTTSMNIGPGESPQLLHADDGMVTLPRPHPATMVTTLWALSDFRADNGATHLVPGSHRHESMPKPGDTHDVTVADMAAGSVLVLHGSTWHGGGRNDTVDERRYGVSVQYVAGWCRQQQNLMLGTDRDVAAGYPQRLQELIGYSMFANVMGHVDRQHPRTLLGDDAALDSVWDRMKRDR